MKCGLMLNRVTAEFGKYMMKSWLMVFLVAATQVWAGELVVRGVIGNSGVSGESLMLTTEPSFRSGLAWGAKKHFWVLVSQKKLLKLDKDGRVVAGFEVDGLSEAETSPVRLASVGNYVVAMFRTNKVLKHIAVDAEPGTKMSDVPMLKRLDWDSTVGMAGEGVKGQIIVTNGREVLAVNPENGDVKKAFEVSTDILEHGVAVNKRGIIYLSTKDKVASCHLDGNSLGSGDSLGPNISAVENYVFGFQEGKASVDRWDLPGGKPLKNVQHPELGTITQAVHLSNTDFAVIGSTGAIYIGQVESSSQLATARAVWLLRYGGISPLGVGVNGEGHIFATIPSKQDYYGGIVAWNWTAKPNSAPDFTHVMSSTLPFGQITSDTDGNTWGVIKKDGNMAQSVTVWNFSLKDGNVTYHTLTGQRPAAPIGMCRLDSELLFVSDGNLDIFASKVPARGQTSKECKVLKWPNDNPLTEPKQLAAWKELRFFVVDGKRIVLVQRTATGCTSLWDFVGPDDAKFGDEIHIATSGDFLFVSDTSRHRVLAFESARRKLVAQLGTLDQAGSQEALNRPTHISVMGNLVVVYDSGNQRILKLRFKQD